VATSWDAVVAKHAKPQRLPGDNRKWTRPVPVHVEDTVDLEAGNEKSEAAATLPQLRASSRLLAKLAPHSVVAQLAAWWQDFTPCHPLAFLVAQGPDFPAARFVELLGNALSAKELAAFRAHCVAEAPEPCLLVSPSAGGARGTQSLGWFQTPPGRVRFVLVLLFAL
jgi:hypothetical protein